MGAAASVRSVYRDATAWFRKYFDDSTYVGDFMSIDKDQDGSVSYYEFAAWLHRKATSESGPWRFFVSHPEIVEVAHTQSSKLARNHKKIVDVNDFRGLLIQLFAVSIFWTHFKRADECMILGDGTQSFDGKLNVEEFTLAVKSFCNAYGQEKLTDESIRSDFLALDKDNSGTLSLLEVCGLCAQFITSDLIVHRTNPEIVGVNVGSEEAPAIITMNIDPSAADPITHTQDFDDDDLRFSRDKLDCESYRNRSTKQAMATLVDEVSKNQTIAEMTEMRMATERILDIEGVMDGL
eukprot:gene24580-29698_t